MTESFNWLGRCARAAAFGIAALLLLTIARIVFFFAYKNDDLGFLSDFAPAMVMGLGAMRVRIVFITKTRCLKRVPPERCGFGRGGADARGVGRAA